MVGQRALYPGNGAGDRSQTWSKVSSKVVLLKYSAIAIFAKIAIWRVFPDTVTFVIGSEKRDHFAPFDLYHVYLEKYCSYRLQNLVFVFFKHRAKLAGNFVPHLLPVWAWHAIAQSGTKSAVFPLC